MPRQARIRSGRDVRRIFRTGRRLRAGPVDVFLADSPAARPRVGIVVPRHGRSAVERNRLRRRLKEIARCDWLPAAMGSGEAVDALLRARPEAYRASYADLRRSVLEAPGVPWSAD